MRLFLLCGRPFYIKYKVMSKLIYYRRFGLHAGRILTQPPPTRCLATYPPCSRSTDDSFRYTLANCWKFWVKTERKGQGPKYVSLGRQRVWSHCWRRHQRNKSLVLATYQQGHLCNRNLMELYNRTGLPLLLPSVVLFMRDFLSDVKRTCCSWQFALCFSHLH